MSEVTVTIFDRDYRLAVSSGEEELLKDCARQVDEQMQTVRAAGRVIANDQIAVLTALEFAYESKKREEEAKDGNSRALPALRGCALPRRQDRHHRFAFLTRRFRISFAFSHQDGSLRFRPFTDDAKQVQ